MSALESLIKTCSEHEDMAAGIIFACLAALVIIMFGIVEIVKAIRK